ncbi:MAG: hypothetical protein WA802_08930 [Terracidiphilus sp.]
MTVTVDAQKDNGLATRSCEATLSWSKEKIQAASDVFQADVESMDIDLGLGVPVVTFEFQKSDRASSMTYEVYSLHGPPQLLRTISGGHFFRSADTDLDGRVEIWGEEAGAADGFEGIPLANFEWLPTIVMRFENRRLIDVSSEFRSYYDGQIARIRAQLDPGQLSDFKSSDGQFKAIPPWEVDKLRGLDATKIKVLEIVWAYVYSGREQEGWQTLADMWPAGDLNRIRALIVSARAGGISSEVDGVAQPGLPPRKLKRVHVFDLIEVRPEESGNASVDINSGRGGPPQLGSSQTESLTTSEGTVKRPYAIELYTPQRPDPEHAIPPSGVPVDLLIDAAGKVSSVKVVKKENQGPVGESLIAASSHWKFVPAMWGGHPVASRFRITVTPTQ